MHKIPLLIILCLLLTDTLVAQITSLRPNAVSSQHPYGKIDPAAYPQVKDYELMIGTCDCKSTQRNQDGTWADSISTVWQFKYILDGRAVQDENWREDGVATSSVRMFNPDSAAWSVTYFSSVAPTFSPGVWRGGKVGDDIVLKRDQTAPNGFPGDSKLTFFNISEHGFSWKSEWVSKDESIVYPTWSIHCKKRKE